MPIVSPVPLSVIVTVTEVLSALYADIVIIPEPFMLEVISVPSAVLSPKVLEAVPEAAKLKEVVPFLTVYELEYPVNSPLNRVPPLSAKNT